MVVPGVVSTLMWKNIFDPNIGALNSFLDVIGKSEWKRSWLGDPKTALGSIIAMGFPWVNSFAFLVFYGGLINIPEDLFEAAKVDGSNPFWNFFHIHLPLISPQIKMLRDHDIHQLRSGLRRHLPADGGRPGHGDVCSGTSNCTMRRRSLVSTATRVRWVWSCSS